MFLKINVINPNELIWLFIQANTNFQSLISIICNTFIEQIALKNVHWVKVRYFWC